MITVILRNLKEDKDLVLNEYAEEEIVLMI